MLEVFGACKIPANDNLLAMILCSCLQVIHSGCCTVRNVEGLHESIVAARAQGCALVDEEFEFGLVSVAAPVQEFKA